MGAFSLTFAGGAGTVTGSKYLIEGRGGPLLLDCGLFQGLKPLRLRNWAEPPFEPRAVTAVVLSHAHLDHSGYLPLLARRGFRGPIYCTAGTRDLLGILLPDAARLQEEDAERAGRRGYSKHRPPLPLFTQEDAERALGLVEVRPRDVAFAVGDGREVVLRRAGHILGASTVELTLAGQGGAAPTRLVFSGDLGRFADPILLPPQAVPRADVLLIESTYGDREHPTNADEALAAAVRETAARGGRIIIPSFAIGRAQELIWYLHQLEERGRIPPLPIFVDSPMAIDATQVFARHPEDHSLALEALTDARRSPFSAHNVRMVRTSDESKALNNLIGPMIIIAGSGMATGGRVLHHLAHGLPDHRNSVLLAGYQAAGTRGRSLAEGAPTVRIHGQDVRIRAQVTMIEGLSAHADRADLLRWLDSFDEPPAMTWVVHGEPTPAAALAASIRHLPGWRAAVAVDGATVPLPPAGEP